MVVIPGFTPNDRKKVREQIQGIHIVVATVTKQPVFMLNNEDADRLTNSLCDVLDYHRINIFEAGGHYGMYVALIVTAWGIYKPRLDYIRVNAGKAPAQAAKPADPTTAKMAPAGMMDFSADNTAH